MRLPSSVRLSKVRQSWEQEKNRTFEILAESPEFPETYEGQVYPEAIIYITEQEGRISVSK